MLLHKPPGDRLSTITTYANQPVDLMAFHKIKQQWNSILGPTLSRSEGERVAAVRGAQECPAPMKQALTRLEIEMNESLWSIQHPIERIFDANNLPAMNPNRIFYEGPDYRI
jgi:hypothetical protein